MKQWKLRIPESVRPSKWAKRLWAEYRLGYGFNPEPVPLLTPPNANMKLAKSANIYGLSLAPANFSDYNVCYYSTKECRKYCVAWNNKGQFPIVQKARVAKTNFMFEEPEAFGLLLKDEIYKAGVKHGGKIAFRLNTFSDVPWEIVAPWIFETFLDVQLYDYTKDWSRIDVPSNYHLTYSAGEKKTDQQIKTALHWGYNIAVIFSHLPDTYLGYPVINGDKTDERWKDPKSVVVGLKAKGRLRNSGSPFIRKQEDEVTGG